MSRTLIRGLEFERKIIAKHRRAFPKHVQAVDRVLPLVTQEVHLKPGFGSSERKERRARFPLPGNHLFDLQAFILGERIAKHNQVDGAGGEYVRDLGEPARRFDIEECPKDQPSSLQKYGVVTDNEDL
jgi:hypothetical protein